MQPSRPLRIALVAGELSGDNLGAGFIRALRERGPGAQFFGIAGPRMQAAGCECWETAESLAVMGLTEVLSHLPRLLALRGRIRDRILAERPDGSLVLADWKTSKHIGTPEQRLQDGAYRAALAEAVHRIW